MAELCAPNVHIDTLHRIASVESSFNPYAIGVVGARLERQPKTLAEAMATAEMLENKGYNYSIGLMQVNKKNFARYGLTWRTGFDVCANLRAGAQILEDCYRRAGHSATALTDAFSCYYTGNFTAGYRLGYVAKVVSVQPPLSLFDLAPATAPVVPRLSVQTSVPRSLRVAADTRKASAPKGHALFVSSVDASTPPSASNHEPPSTPLSDQPVSALLF